MKEVRIQQAKNGYVIYTEDANDQDNIFHNHIHVCDTDDKLAKIVLEFFNAEPEAS